MDIGNPAEELEKQFERWQKQGESTFWGLLGCEFAGWDGKTVTVALDVKPQLLNLIGILHGGVHATLIDSAMGLVVMIARPRENVVTTNLNLNYVAPASEGRILVTAELLHATRKSMNAQAFVRTEGGELLAFGTGTFRVMDRKPESQ